VHFLFLFAKLVCCVCSNEALASLINSSLDSLKLGLVRPVTLSFYFPFFLSRNDRDEFDKGTIGSS
jgi:hypothetical protein